MAGPVTWITAADVAGAVGIPPAAAGDDAWLGAVTDAANAWAFRARATAGYADDPTVAPGDDAHLGTVLYAMARYRDRGSVDAPASFAELDGGTAATGGTWAEIRRLLGIPKAATDAPAVVAVAAPTPADPVPPVFGPYPAGWQT
jgi:hypothetical protein